MFTGISSKKDVSITLFVEFLLFIFS